MEIFAVGVGEFRTGLGPDVIDAAIVISSQKGTGHLLEYVIRILINS